MLNGYQDDYPLDAWPEPERSAIIELREYFNLRTSVAATMMLLGQGTSVLGHGKVRLLHGHVRSASIYTTWILPSGSRFTALMDEVMKPVVARDKARADELDREIDVYKTKVEAWTAIRSGFMRALRNATEKGQPIEEIERQLMLLGPKPKKPRVAKLLHSDITKFAAVHAGSNGDTSMAFVSDEGELFKKGPNQSEFGFFNKLWDGASLEIVRGHGHRISTESPNVMLGMRVHPEVFMQFMKQYQDAARGTGYLARMLFDQGAPMIGQGYVQSVAPMQWQALGQVHARMAELLAESGPYAELPEPPIIELDADAKAFQAWNISKLENAQLPGGPLDGVRDFAAKAPENANRIAGIWHLFHRKSGLISRDLLERAEAVVRYHLNEAQRIFAVEPARTELQADCLAIEAYFQRKVQSNWSSLPYRYILRNGPVRDKLRLDAVLYTLTAQGKVTVHALPKKPKLVVLYIAYFLSLPQH